MLVGGTICGLLFLFAKLKGQNPESNIFTFWFGFGIAGPLAVFGYGAVVLNFVPHHHFSANPMHAFIAFVPAIYIYHVVLKFFAPTRGEKNNR